MGEYGRESGARTLHPHVLNVLGIQMKSRLHMQSSHVPHTTWLINKQITSHMFID